MAEAARLQHLTLEEFYALPDDGLRHELQAGLLISEPPPGFRHGFVTMNLGALLQQHVRKNDLGVVTSESGFLLARSPATVRGPDVAYVSKARVVQLEDPVRAFPGAPDLAVEVLSPSNSPAVIHAKVADYLAAGTRLVWVVDGDARTVTEYATLLSPRVLGCRERLDGRNVVPGFSTAVSEIFHGTPNP